MKAMAWAWIAALALAACGDDAGPMAGDGATCGGFRGMACDDGLFCDYPAGAACGAADGVGTCQPRPQICTPIVQPVCGCDGRRYNSACEAHRAGVDDQSETACR